MIRDDLLPTERVAIVVALLKDGEHLTPARVAALTGITWGAAWLMLNKISRVLPVDEQDGVWFIVFD